MKKQFSEEPVIGFHREAEAGIPVAELCRKHVFRKGVPVSGAASFSGWASLTPSDIRSRWLIPLGGRDCQRCAATR